MLIGCKKKDTTPTTPSTCNCYKREYTKGAGGVYYFTTQSDVFVDLCAKNGLIEYSGMGIYKIVWTCN